MLKVTLHSGAPSGRSLHNQLAVLDIAYAKREAIAEYLLAYSARGLGEAAPELLVNYPRWAASLWDLVARGLTRVLFHADQAPPAGKPDRRCAYATRLYAVIEMETLDSVGVEVATAEITQNPRQRGSYTVRFTEDIMGPRTGRFEYGKKALDPAELLLRAICWTYYGSDTLGPMPALILPPSMTVGGVEQFHLEALREPAKTGFLRHIGKATPLSRPAAMQPAAKYVDFLMRG